MSSDDTSNREAEDDVSSEIRNILDRIQSLEVELETAFDKVREDLRYRIENNNFVFDDAILQLHHQIKVRLWDYVKQARPLVVLTAPFIYGLIIPLVLLDIFVSIYQAVCFPVYGITKVKRANYIVFDRERLAYLNALEKLNCAYCSYANGLVGYVREIAGRTEKHWCPIKHARRLASPHAQYKDFVEFGDAEAYRKQLDELSRKLSGTKDDTP